MGIRANLRHSLTLVNDQRIGERKNEWAAHGPFVFLFWGRVMPELSFVARVARTVYGLDPHAIEALDRFPSQERGIYRIEEAQAGVWVLRMSKRRDMAEVDA